MLRNSSPQRKGFGLPGLPRHLLEGLALEPGSRAKRQLLESGRLPASAAGLRRKWNTRRRGLACGWPGGELAEHLDVLRAHVVRPSLSISDCTRGIQFQVPRCRRRRRSSSSSPSSRSSLVLNLACAGPRRPMTWISRTRLAAKASSALRRDVGGSELVHRPLPRMRQRSVATLPWPITATTSSERSNLRAAVIRMAVVPGDELGGGVAARQIFPRNAETPVGLGAAGEHHRVIVGAQLLHRHVAPHAHVGEQS